MSVLVLLASLASAQTHQGALWIEVGGDLGVSDRVEFSLSEELRQEVFRTGTTELLTDAAVRVDLARWVALQGNYRFTWDLTAPGVAHRLAGDLRLRHRVGDVRLRLRQRYQVAMAPVGTEHALRTRLSAEYRLDRARPFLSSEAFLGLTGGARLDKVRVTAGVKLPTAGPTMRLYSHFDQQLDGDWRLVGGIAGTFGARLYEKDQD